MVERVESRGCWLMPFRPFRGQHSSRITWRGYDDWPFGVNMVCVSCVSAFVPIALWRASAYMDAPSGERKKGERKLVGEVRC